MQAVGEQILSAIDQPFQLDEDSFQTTASIGAALFQADDQDLDEVLKRADLAMYEAKAAGRGTRALLPARRCRSRRPTGWR